MTTFTHLDEHGHARMVNVTAKAETSRLARARGKVLCNNLDAVDDSDLRSYVIAANTAGLRAAKQTPLLIPLCHSLSAATTEMTFQIDSNTIEIQAIAKTYGRTGVEMEALTSCMIAALTLLTAFRTNGLDARIDNVTLLEKVGGKSGHWRNPTS